MVHNNRVKTDNAKDTPKILTQVNVQVLLQMCEHLNTFPKVILSVNTTQYFKIK